MSAGFRRRCGWCGVPLKWWQLNLCRMCRPAVVLDAPSPPCGYGSRWHEEDEYERG